MGDAKRGSKAAVSEMFADFYPELRRMAHARLRRKRDALTLLGTTSLVHESYFRFVRNGQIQVKDRPHFLAYAARVMRSVIVDSFREQCSLRRGGDGERVALESPAVEAVLAGENGVLRIHEALEQLSRVDDRMAQVVEMRYFAGMTEMEIAEALDITDRTVRRDWEKARIFLAAELE
jgi:RNA polymerase sigma factor (TIGR02999 family)